MAKSDTGANGETGPGPRGIVLLVHGGQSESMVAVTPRQLAVLRMVPLAAAIRRAVGTDGIEVRRPLLSVRGWNGEQASPVADVARMLDAASAGHPAIPVVLVGHSMGARAALRVAGHPSVIAVAGLAPWLPAGEPVEQLAGRRVLVAHGTGDMITSPRDTRAYAERARAVCELTAIEVRRGEHTMVRRVGLWHALAAEFTRIAFGLSGGSGMVATAVAAAARGTELITLD